MNDFKKFLLDALDDDKKDHVLLKSVPATKEQKKAYEEVIELAKQSALLEKKRDSTLKLFWATVDKEMDEYRHMHYNADTDEIEIFANEFDEAKKKGKSVRSPIQIKL